MTYIFCIIIGTVLTTLSIIGTYEFVGYDIAIMIWFAAYTVGLVTAMYGVANTRRNK
jgi:hypothetical protein